MRSGNAVKLDLKRSKNNYLFQSRNFVKRYITIVGFLDSYVLFYKAEKNSAWNLLGVGVEAAKEPHIILYDSAHMKTGYKASIYLDKETGIWFLLYGLLEKWDIFEVGRFLWRHANPCRLLKVKFSLVHLVRIELISR